MINDLIKLFRAEGIDVPDTVGRAVEVKLRQQYGGERVYVASLPKQKRAAQLAKLEKMTLRKMSVVTGIPVRTIQRIKNGR